MSSRLSKYFSYDSGFTHPRIKIWSSMLERTDVNSARIHILLQQDILGFVDSAKIILEFIGDKNIPIQSEEADWDSELNRGLVELGIRAFDLENEKLRFFLSFRDGFKKPEIRFGDGFFNATLGYILRNGPLGDFEAVKAILDEIHTNKPHMSGTSYQSCVEMIESIISENARALEAHLHYSRKDSEEILSNAIAMYLDIRFFVSSRRKIGFQ